MTIKEKNLLNILQTRYLENVNVTFVESKNLRDTKEEEDLLDVYQSLGGIMKYPEVRLNGYFFETSKFALELDGQLSFNRYRLKTLRSPIYQKFLGVKPEKYRSHCKKYENECIKSGTTSEIWNNKKAEALFGESEKAGDLGLNGSAGWKLKAFEDFLKDIYSKYAKIKLLRISVWDEVLINGQLKKLGDLLNTPDKKTSEFLLKFIERRVINLFAD